LSLLCVGDAVTHYAQIETKLTMRGADMDEIQAKLAPVPQEVRRRLGNFILAEDDQTLSASCWERSPPKGVRSQSSRPSPADRPPAASLILKGGPRYRCALS
jgi:hypothetical protein